MEMTMELEYAGVFSGDEGEQYMFRDEVSDKAVFFPCDLLPRAIRDSADRFRSDAQGREGLPVKLVISWSNY